MKAHLWRVYAGLGAIALCLYTFVPGAGWKSIAYNAIGLSAVAATLVGLRLHRPPHPWPWRMLALGLLLSVAGDAAYFVEERLRGAVAIPSPSDAFYLTGYVLLAVGLTLLVGGRIRGSDPAAVIDAAILAAGFGVVSWVYLMAPYAGDQSLSLTAKLVSLAYPAADVFLAVGAARLAFGLGKHNPAHGLVLLAFAALLVAEFSYTASVLNGSYYIGHPADLGYILQYVLLGAAALHPSLRLLVPVSPKARSVSRRWLALLATASLLAPAVLAIQAARGERLEIRVVVAGSVVVFLLVVMRMAGLVRQLDQSLELQTFMRSAADRLVSSSTREAIYATAVDSIEQLGRGFGLRVLISEGRRDAITIVAGGGEGHEEALGGTMPLRSLNAAVLEQLLERRMATLDRSEDIDPERLLPHRPRSGPGLALPLFSGNRLSGAITVESYRALPAEVERAIERIGSQVTVALESVAQVRELHEQRSQRRFGSMVQNSSDVILLVSQETVIRYASPSSERVLGLTAEDLAGAKLLELVDPGDRDGATAAFARVEAASGLTFRAEWRLRRPDGRCIYAEAVANNLLSYGDVRSIVVTMRDIGERKALEEQLSHQAFHDALTGLANRALFQDRVQHALARARRDLTKVGVLFIDLDEFKTVNDSLGHIVGDELLKVAASRLATSLRPSDTAARFGGDEFAVLLEDTSDTSDPARVAERIIAAIEQPLSLGSRELSTGASIGIAIGGADGTTSEELLRNADIAMYKAKQRGGSRYELFEPAMHTAALQRLELEAELRHAIEQREFVLHYQPILSLATGALVAVEALVRWQHPKRGLLPPGVFVGLAEETGLIVSIDRWVLGAACREGQRLQAERAATSVPIAVHVNFSARQLQLPRIVAEVEAALEQYGLEPENLVVEITESVMMQDTDGTIEKLEALHELGVRIAIDDFGTGYSSLSYLERFPVHMVKIAKEFTDTVAGGGQRQALAHGILELGRALDLAVVAEGIEHHEQLAQLRRLRCGMGQGYLFARPMSGEALRRPRHAPFPWLPWPGTVNKVAGRREIAPAPVRNALL